MSFAALLRLLVQRWCGAAAGESYGIDAVGGAHRDQFGFLGVEVRVIVAGKGVHDVDLFRIDQLSGPIQDR